MDRRAISSKIDFLTTYKSALFLCLLFVVGFKAQNNLRRTGHVQSECQFTCDREDCGCTVATLGFVIGTIASTRVPELGLLAMMNSPPIR
jgi:hypothetical protein